MIVLEFNLLIFILQGGMSSKLRFLQKCLTSIHPRKQIKVATLNFSGINTNPFQYYDGSDNITKISEYMKIILDQEQQILKSSISKIDKIYTNNKISIRFGNFFQTTSHLLTRQQYTKKWIEFFTQNRPQALKKLDIKQIQSNILFDYYCYLSVVKHLYGVDWKISQIIEKQTSKKRFFYDIEGIDKIQSGKLKQFLSAIQKRPASQISLKYKLIQDYLLRNKLDIFFIQQGGLINIQNFHKQGYVCVKGGDSLIVFKQNLFGANQVRLTDKYKGRLNFNNDSAFYFGDKGYLILSVHLKSKRQYYINQMRELLQTVKVVLEQNPELKLIIGMDANHFIGEHGALQINYAPQTKQEFTTNKMRTYLQTQFQKARIHSKQPKDFILSNLAIKDYKILKINDKQAESKDMLPSNDHPYDHFIVKATIIDKS